MKKYQVPIILVSLSLGMLSFLLPIYSRKLDMNAYEISWLFSIISLVNLILRPVIGHLIDRYGRKKFLMLSCFLFGFSMFVYAYAYSDITIYIARTFQAIASSILMITIYSISIDLSRETDKGSHIGFLQSASSKGSLIGAVFGFTFLSYYSFEIGFKYLFIIYGMLAFVGGFYTLIKLEDTKKRVVKTKYKFDYNRSIVILLFITLFSALTQTMISPIFIVYLQDHFTKEIGLLAQVFIPAALIYSIFPKHAGTWIDKIGRKRGMIFGLVISATCSILIVNINSLGTLLFLWAFEAIGITLLTVGRKALISDLTDRTHIGKNYSQFMVVASIGGFVGPLIGGYIYEVLNPVYPFYLYAFVSIISLIVIVGFIHNKTNKCDIIDEKEYEEVSHDTQIIQEYKVRQ